MRSECMNTVILRGLCAGFAAFAALCCFSCVFMPETMTQTIRLPEFPEVWAGAEYWELGWETESGSSGKIAARAGTCVPLELPIRAHALVFARAVYGSFSTKPYGALWPQDLGSDGFLEPSAAGGWCASLALPLLRAGWDLHGFNWKRLSGELAGRLNDPWEIAPSSFCGTVLEGKFRSDYLREPGMKLETAISGIVQAMYPSSPWGQVLVPDTDGAVRCAVSPGSYVWMNAGSCLRVSVSASGEASHTFSVLP